MNHFTRNLNKMNNIDWMQLMFCESLRLSEGRGGVTRVVIKSGDLSHDEMETWFHAHDNKGRYLRIEDSKRVNAVSYAVIVLTIWPFTMAWFDDKDLAMLFKLTFGGK